MYRRIMRGGLVATVAALAMLPGVALAASGPCPPPPHHPAAHAPCHPGKHEGKPPRGHRPPAPPAPHGRHHGAPPCADHRK